MVPIFMKDAHSTYWIEWKINFPIFIFFVIFWLYLKFTKIYRPKRSGAACVGVYVRKSRLPKWRFVSSIWSAFRWSNNPFSELFIDSLEQYKYAAENWISKFKKNVQYKKLYATKLYAKYAKIGPEIVSSASS